MIVHSFTIGEWSFTPKHVCRLSDFCVQVCKNSTSAFGDAYAPGVVRPGIAFGANTDVNTIVALIVALCFHVSSLLGCAIVLTMWRVLQEHKIIRNHACKCL